MKEADELIRLAERKNLRIFFVYHNRRWDADFLTIQKLLKSKLLGDISYYESHFDRYKPEISENWRDKEIAGSGVLYDLGPHLIDQVLILLESRKACGLISKHSDRGLVLMIILKSIFNSRIRKLL